MCHPMMGMMTTIGFGIEIVMNDMILIVLRQQYDALIALGHNEIASYVAGAIMRLEAL